MSDECCDRTSDPGGGSCPTCRTKGLPVRWTTVAALTLGPVPPRGEFSLCLDTDCDVVYFGGFESPLLVEEVRVLPRFKRGSEGFVCYCFLHTRESVVAETRALGNSPTLESIRNNVKNKGCACEVRNPTGKCCLREIQQIIEAEASRQGVAP